MKSHTKRAWTSMVLTFVFIHTVIFSGVAQAAMVTTPQAMSIQQQQFDKAQLISALDNQQVQDKLTALGVDIEHAKERVAMMTPEEIRKANQQLESMPAGQDLIGALVLIFLVFIITDMLCATNIYSFVNCVNK